LTQLDTSVVRGATEKAGGIYCRSAWVKQATVGRSTDIRSKIPPLAAGSYGHNVPGGIAGTIRVNRLIRPLIVGHLYQPVVHTARIVVVTSRPRTRAVTATVVGTAYLGDDAGVLIVVSTKIGRVAAPCVSR